MEAEQEECTPKRSCEPVEICNTDSNCDSVPTCEREESDCDEQPTPRQQREVIFAKIAALLRKLGCEDYADDCDEPETPSAACESNENGSAARRWNSSCDSDPPRTRGGSKCEAQELRRYSDKSENCRVVDRCWSDTNWNPSVNRARFR